LLDSKDIRRVSRLRRDFRPSHYLLHCEIPLGHAVTGELEVTHACAGMMRELLVVQRDARMLAV